ncbi:hypothetical protein Y023_4133 [Burkholderia pseudomallei A79D]|nr:hypothetical protein Y023_4133 [Burkholderia pseudomallei A79D]KGX99961.1 hypothetical protein X997_3826 [Burkholderia pseudomallei A79C]
MLTLLIPRRELQKKCLVSNTFADVDCLQRIELSARKYLIRSSDKLLRSRPNLPRRKVLFPRLYPVRVCSDVNDIWITKRLQHSTIRPWGWHPSLCTVCVRHRTTRSLICYRRALV